MVIQRLSEVYAAIYFDEIQDLAGDDIEILDLLFQSPIAIVCCGDNKQATFKTHNSKKNKNKTGRNIWNFFYKHMNEGLVSIQQNLISRRFNHQICEFANIIFPSEIKISTIMNKETGHDGVFLISMNDVNLYYNVYHPQILRYSSATNTEGYQAINFGACKGETFDRILIFPNKPLESFIINHIPLKAPEKYYVAVTRPRYSIAIVLNSLPNELEGYREEIIKCDLICIRSLKFLDTTSVITDDSPRKKH